MSVMSSRSFVLVVLRTFVGVHIINYGISPDEVSWPKQVEAVVGEVFTEFAVHVNKERVEVNPSDSLSFARFLHGTVAVDYHLFAVFKEFPHLHIGVERQHRLYVDFGAWRAFLDKDNEFLHNSPNAVAVHSVRHVIHAAEDENLAWLSLQDGFHSLVESLHNVANDAAVLHVWVIEELVPLSAIGEAVAKHDDVVAIHWQVIEVCCTAHVVLVLVGSAL